MAKSLSPHLFLYLLAFSCSSLVALGIREGALAERLGLGQEGQQLGNECQLDKINALEPTSRIESEAGLTEFWDHNEDQFRCAGVAFMRRTIQENGLLLPYFRSAPELYYVLRGKGIRGLAIPGCPETFQSVSVGQSEEEGRRGFRDQHQKVRRFRQGDVFALPAGVVQWLFNDGDEELVLVTLIDSTNEVNQLDQNSPRRFHLAGNPEQEFSEDEQSRKGQKDVKNIFEGFDSEILEQVFGLPKEIVERIQGSQDDRRGQIVKAEQFRVIRPPTLREEEQWEERRGLGGGCSQERRPFGRGSEEWEEIHGEGDRGSRWSREREEMQGERGQRERGSEEWEEIHGERGSSGKGSRGERGPRGQGSREYEEIHGERGPRGHGSREYEESHSERGPRGQGSQEYEEIHGERGPRGRGSREWEETRGERGQGSKGSREWGEIHGERGPRGQGSREYEEIHGERGPSGRGSREREEIHGERGPGSREREEMHGERGQRERGSEEWEEIHGERGSSGKGSRGERGPRGHGSREWEEIHGKRGQGSKGSREYEETHGERGPRGQGSREYEEIHGERGPRGKGSREWEEIHGERGPSGRGSREWEEIHGERGPSGRGSREWEEIHGERGQGSRGSKGSHEWEEIRGERGQRGQGSREYEEIRGERGQGSRGSRRWEEIHGERFPSRRGSGREWEEVHCGGSRGGRGGSRGSQGKCRVCKCKTTSLYDPSADLNGVEETICSARLRENIDDPSRADIFIPQAGRLTTLNSFNLPVLGFLGLSAERGVLYRNAIMAPHWNLNAHSVIYGTRGSARVQIVNEQGKDIFHGVLRENQVVVAPQNFVLVKQAGDEGFEWVSFKTNDNAVIQTVTGRVSALRALPVEVVMSSYQLSREQAEKLKLERRETVLLAGGSRSGDDADESERKAIA